jgi:polar amino acid transport system substrate-binding protein
MNRMARCRIGVLTAVGAGVATVLAGCSAPDNGPKQALAEASSTPAAVQPAQSAGGSQSSAAKASCSPAADASFAPLAALPAPGSMPDGSLEREIATRKLVVGVSGDTRLLGARNSLNGGALEGFDIEMARTVARAIFGPANVDNHIQFKVITAGQRFRQVNDGVAKGGVDLVARAVSMTCDRWVNKDLTKGADFSAGYFKSDQRILVRSDSSAKNITGLAKDVAARTGASAKVCAPTGSTSLANIQKITGVTPVAVDIHSDCMALWQEGKVDAITGDDAILAGFKAQDPRAAIRGEAMDTTDYAFAIARSHPEFVKFVNAVLASPAGHAAWTAAYGAWLAVPMKDQPQTQPEPNYARTP